MNVVFKQISSLEKVRCGDEINYNEVKSKTMLGGERFSYQICAKKYDMPQMLFHIEVESEIAQYVKVFNVKNVPMDNPVTEEIVDDDYITHEAGLMPDLLIPAEENSNEWTVMKNASAIWVRVELPRGFKAGKYPVTIKLVGVQEYNKTQNLSCNMIMNIEALGIDLPSQELIYTRWLYADCIADIHNVEPFSEEHWELIDKYLAAATSMGINMILLPVHTPPLDTEIGSTRTCVQLVDITYENGKYSFGFERFRRFVGLCRKNGVKYYEMAHMFSQWGAKCAPNIKVCENGKTDYKFGWHVASDSKEYIEFLSQYIAEISDELKNEGIDANTFFHISDEPSLEALDAYMVAYNILRPHIGNGKTLDALAKYDFYEKGLVDCPVTSVSYINDFLPHKIENQWVYYCCGPQNIYTNSIMAMPSCRERIVGIQMYKYNIQGFLHWGFNFYNSLRSHHKINPYVTTSADGAFPSGDPFVVYPGKDCVYGSIRGEVMYEAIQDMSVCRALEALSSHESVVAMIEREAEMELEFDKYPKNKDFLPTLREKMIEEIKRLSK